MILSIIYSNLLFQPYFLTYPNLCSIFLPNRPGLFTYNFPSSLPYPGLSCFYLMKLYYIASSLAKQHNLQEASFGYLSIRYHFFPVLCTLKVFWTFLNQVYSFLYNLQHTVWVFVILHSGNKITHSTRTYLVTKLILSLNIFIIC